MTAQPIVRGRPRIRIVASRRLPAQRISGWLISSVVVALVFFGLIYSHTRLNTSALELQRLESEIGAELDKMETLNLEVARLQSPAIVAPAAEQLGLVFPTEMRTLTAPGVVVQSDAEVERLADLKAALGEVR